MLDKRVKYMVEGETCAVDADCINLNIALDDDQEAYVLYELRGTDTLHGTDLGLFCDISDTLTCMEKLEDRQPCASDSSCKSNHCRSLTIQDSTGGNMICISRDHIQPGMSCASAGEPCEGGICWEDSSSSVSATGTKTYYCRPLSKLGEPCEVMWDKTGHDAVVIMDSCDVRDGDHPMFTTNQTYCLPDNHYRPLETATINAERMSSGVCTAVEEKSEDEACLPYYPSTTGPSCGWGSFCKTSSTETQNVTSWYKDAANIVQTKEMTVATRVCKDYISEDDPCDSDDHQLVGNVMVSGCGSSHMCNFKGNTDTPKTGVCHERFSLLAGEDASHPELCDPDTESSSLVMVYNTDTNKCQTSYLDACSTDADCYSTTLIPSLPIYCDKTSSTSQGECKALIPTKCLDEWKDWRLWHTGDRFKGTYTLRVRGDVDKRYVEALACCYQKEAGLMSTCLRDSKANAVLGSVPTEFMDLVAGVYDIQPPKFLQGAQWLNLEGDAADLCSDKGMSLATILIYTVGGGLLFLVSVFVLTRECCCKKSQREKGRLRREKAKEHARQKKDEDKRRRTIQRRVEHQMKMQNPLRNEKDAPLSPMSGVNLLSHNGTPGQATPGHAYTPRESPADEPMRVPGVANEPATSPARLALANARQGVLPSGTPVKVFYDGQFDGWNGWYDAEIVGRDDIEDTYDVMYSTNEVSRGVCAASVHYRV